MKIIGVVKWCCKIIICYNFSSSVFKVEIDRIRVNVSKNDCHAMK